MTTVQRYTRHISYVWTHLSWCDNFGECGEKVNTSDCESDSAGSSPVTHPRDELLSCGDSLQCIEQLDTISAVEKMSSCV